MRNVAVDGEAKLKDVHFSGIRVIQKGKNS